MKFIICDSTHYFHLVDFLKNYKSALNTLNYQIITIDDMSKGLDDIDRAKISNAFDYRTSKGCMIEIDNLEQLQEFSNHLDDKHLFIDMKLLLIVITAYYPDD